MWQVSSQRLTSGMRNVITAKLSVNLDHMVFFLVGEFCSLLVLLGFCSSRTLWLTLALRVADDPISSSCEVFDCEMLSGSGILLLRLASALVTMFVFCALVDWGLLLLRLASALVTIYVLCVFMNWGLIVVIGFILVENCGISLSN